MIEIQMLNAQIAVAPKDNQKIMALKDPQSGIHVVVIFDEDSAKKIGAALMSSIPILPAGAANGKILETH